MTPRTARFRRAMHLAVACVAAWALGGPSQVSAETPQAARIDSPRLASPPSPPSETGRLGRSVPDIPIVTTTGVTRLAALGASRPIVLGFVFTRCGGVCSPFLRSWLAADRRLGAAGAVTRVVLSFDPRDSVDDLRALASHVGVPEGPDWVFGVADPEDLRQVADAVGFWWTWDAGRRQFDHPALLAGVRDGRLARLLVGGTVTPVRLDELLRDLSGAVVASYPLPGRVLFRCFDVDATTGETRLDWGFVVLFLPVAVAGGMTTTLFVGGARTRRPSRRPDVPRGPSCAASPPRDR